MRTAINVACTVALALMILFLMKNTVIISFVHGFGITIL